jgi:thymidylate synthase (FAD)
MSNVNLIGITKPTAYTEARTANELVAYTARVSNPANQNSHETAGKLIKYLIKNDHWSPLEMVHIVMEIKTTRDISRQILRHRSFSFQEFSQRYAAVGDSFVDEREARLQDTKNRQNSIETDDVRLQEQFRMKQVEVKFVAKNAYEWALNKGIAKEQARVFLPEGLTETTLYMAGTLRSWIHYCQLRMKNGTQKEHAEIAIKCWDIIGFHFPDIVEALSE